MKVNKSHHEIAKSAFVNKTATLAVISTLITKGLTKAQANAACRTARKQLSIYKNISKAKKAEAYRAKKDAMYNATKRTKVNEDEV